MKRKRRLSVKSLRFPLLFICFFLSSLASATDNVVASPTNYEMVEAPTAYILLHGGYDLNVKMYENGGLFARANLGFQNLLMAGFSGNATNVVGTGEIQIQTPRLFLKFQIVDEKTSPVALAVAWDDRGYGTVVDGRFFPGTQKGFYTVASHEFKDMGYIQVHGGVNVVKFDNFDSSQDLGAFLGTSFAVAKPLMFNLELNQLFTAYWQFNANMMFNVESPLRVGIELRDINRSDLFSRIAQVQFLGFF